MIVFNQPTDFFPALNRAALTRDIIPATTGAEADVPPPEFNPPPMKKR
jgi:hypothetical protein